MFSFVVAIFGIFGWFWKSNAKTIQFQFYAFHNHNWHFVFRETEHTPVKTHICTDWQKSSKQYQFSSHCRIRVFVPEIKEKWTFTTIETWSSTELSWFDVQFFVALKHLNLLPEGEKSSNYSIWTHTPIYWTWTFFGFLFGLWKVKWPKMQHFGKRKFGGTQTNQTDYFMLPKNQRLRPCRDIVYTEDHVPVRKLYFCVPTADVSNNSKREREREREIANLLQIPCHKQTLLTKSHCIRIEWEHHCRDANHMLNLVKW